MSCEEALDAAEQGLRPPPAPSRSSSRARDAASRRTRSRVSCARALGSDLGDPARRPSSSRSTAFRAPLSAIGYGRALPRDRRPPRRRACAGRRSLAPGGSPRRRGDRHRPSGRLDPRARRGSAACVCAELARRFAHRRAARARTAASARPTRVALVWSEDDPTGGQHLAALAAGLDLAERLRRLLASEHAERPRCRRGVAPGRRGSGHGPGRRRGARSVDRLRRRGARATPRRRARRPRPLRALDVDVHDRGDRAVPRRPARARRTSSETARPSNLEGRHQRQRRAVARTPGWDELEFFARLAQRFGVDVSPWPIVRRRAGVAPAANADAPAPSAPGDTEPEPNGTGAGCGSALPVALPGAASSASRSSRSSGRSAELELSAADAKSRGVWNGRRGARRLERHGADADGEGEPTAAGRSRPIAERARARPRRGIEVVTVER